MAVLLPEIKILHWDFCEFKTRSLWGFDRATRPSPHLAEPDIFIQRISVSYFKTQIQTFSCQLFQLLKVFLPLEHDFDLCFYRCEFYTYFFTVIFGIQIIKWPSFINIRHKCCVFTPCLFLCCLQPQQHTKLSHAMQCRSISWGCYDPRPTFLMSPASKLSCRAIKTKH